jgi:ribosomal protein S18 acetylase RimI-like enzyme
LQGFAPKLAKGEIASLSGAADDPRYFQISVPVQPGNSGGALVVAIVDDRPAGCVGFRELSAGVCEMKRLYVDTSFHGKGVGRALVSTLISEAKLAGYSTMRLDTGPNQSEAQNLYSSAGFRLIQPYYDLPDELRTWLVFMELDLTTSPVT